MSSTCPDSTCRLRNIFGYCTSNGPCIMVDTKVALKTATPTVNGWISVKDRLPEAVEEDADGVIAFSDFVLVSLQWDDGYTFITTDKCRVDKKVWLSEVPGEGIHVTHWMPLPEPPEEDE